MANYQHYSRGERGRKMRFERAMGAAPIGTFGIPYRSAAEVRAGKRRYCATHAKDRGAHPARLDGECFACRGIMLRKAAR